MAWTLLRKGKANPTAVRTLKCKTVQTKFRHENYVRDLDAHIIDEPPGLLGDDTAPNPSEAVLAASDHASRLVSTQIASLRASL